MVIDKSNSGCDKIGGFCIRFVQELAKYSSLAKNW